MCVHVHLLRVFTCVYVHGYASVYVCVSLCSHVCAHVSLCSHACGLHVCACMRACACTCVCAHVCVRLCVTSVLGTSGHGATTPQPGPFVIASSRGRSGPGRGVFPAVLSETTQGGSWAPGHLGADRNRRVWLCGVCRGRGAGPRARFPRAGRGADARGCGSVRGADGRADTTREATGSGGVTTGAGVRAGAVTAAARGACHTAVREAIPASPVRHRGRTPTSVEKEPRCLHFNSLMIKEVQTDQ